MKKTKWIYGLLAMTLGATMLWGCGKTGSSQSTSAAAAVESTMQTETTAQSEASMQSETTTQGESKEQTEAGAETKAAEESVNAESAEKTESSAQAENTGSALRIGSLKGPTSMGLVKLMEDSEAGNAAGSYSFRIEAQPDVILAALVKGDVDIALIPANMAAIAYQKTEQQISVLDLNTLGVLYCVTGDESIKSVKDLAGKTVLSTGQGASPEYVMNYLLEKNGVTDCTMEFKSEATEIAAALKQDPTQIAILPQPFATAALLQNDQLKTAFSLTDAWDEVSQDSSLVTGVTVVRKSVLESNPEAVKTFLEEQKKSADWVNASAASAGELVAKYGILESAAVAAKAIPACSIVCVDGEEMKTALSGYLSVLFSENPKSVGGSLPEDDFYFLQ